MDEARIKKYLMKTVNEKFAINTLFNYGSSFGAKVDLLEDGSCICLSKNSLNIVINGKTLLVRVGNETYEIKSPSTEIIDVKSNLFSKNYSLIRGELKN